MPQKPFQAAQFTPTPYYTAEDKTKWANAMASWVERGFPANGWTKSLYKNLSTNMYGHIAHYNQPGFYDTWFSDIHQQLEWLQFAASGGTFGQFPYRDPNYTWCDVERAFKIWIRASGLLAKYEKLCAADIEARERARLTTLQAKYQER